MLQYVFYHGIALGDIIDISYLGLYLEGIFQSFYQRLGICLAWLAFFFYLDILLTGFLGIKDDVAKQCAMVRRIAERGCAALVVCYVGRGVKFIDGKVIEAAEETMLPLVLMPESEGYSHAITEVMDKVLYGDNFRNTLISNTVFHLLLPAMAMDSQPACPRFFPIAAPEPELFLTLRCCNCRPQTPVPA